MPAKPTAIGDRSVAALQGAVDTMGDATTDMKEGVFLTSMHTKMQKARWHACAHSRD